MHELTEASSTTTSTRQLLERYDRPGPALHLLSHRDRVSRRRQTRHLRRAAGAAQPRRRCAAVRLPAPAVLRAAVLLLRLQRGDHAASRGRRAATSMRWSRKSTCSPRICPGAGPSRNCTWAAARRPTTRPINWAGCSSASRATFRSRRTPSSASKSIPASPRSRTSTCCGRSASTACRWACRTSMRKCRRRSIASRATS